MFPHADLPHLLPAFRLCRALAAPGIDAWVLGSDAETIGRGHSEAWAGLLGAYGLRDRARAHREGDGPLVDWLLRQRTTLGLDLLVVDAVWQGLAWGCSDAFAGRVVVHHAGLPDFRTGDMPTWYFVHPGHPKERHAIARRSNDEREQAGEGIRGLLASVKALSDAGRHAEDVFAYGCGEFADLPATRATSLCPAHEFPGERGRVAYFGTLLPRPDDIDWRPLPAGLADANRGLIACVFGTSGLRSASDYGWLCATAARLARRFADCDVVAVVPEAMRPATAGAPPNLTLASWIPLWEVLATRRGRKVLVSTPGVGAFREATASGTPIVAVPRSLDQFGAASRVEYFGIGEALVVRELPATDDVVASVASVLASDAIAARSLALRDEIAAYDATRPLERFLADVARR